MGGHILEQAYQYQLHETEAGTHFLTPNGSCHHMSQCPTVDGDSKQPTNEGGLGGASSVVQGSFGRLAILVS